MQNCLFCDVLDRILSQPFQNLWDNLNQFAILNVVLGCRLALLIRFDFGWNATMGKINKWNYEYEIMDGINKEPLLPVMCPSHFCRVRVTTSSSQSRVRVIWNFVELSHDLVESSHKNGRVTSSHWFTSSSQCRVIHKFQTFPIYLWL